MFKRQHFIGIIMPVVAWTNLIYFEVKLQSGYGGALIMINGLIHHESNVAVIFQTSAGAVRYRKLY